MGWLFILLDFRQILAIVENKGDLRVSVTFPDPAHNLCLATIESSIVVFQSLTWFKKKSNKAIGYQ